MSVGRLQTHTFPKGRPEGAELQKPPTPVKGEAAPQAVTPAGVNAREIEASHKVSSPVSVDVLDAFLKARAGKPVVDRGLLPSLSRLLGNKPAPSSEAVALQKTLGAAVQSLGAIYADGLVTEGELSQLHAARGQLRAVLGLAEPAVLNMLPRDVRERLQNQLLEPLATLEQAATRRADRVFTQVQQRDEGALRERLSQAPTFRHVDVGGLQRQQIPPFSLARYQPGDFVAVPRSDGSFQKGVVTGNDGGGLRVEVMDPRTRSLALKTLSAAEVARANPLKIGDYLELPGVKLWVTDAGPGGVKGKSQDAAGHVKDVDANTIAQLAVSAFSQPAAGAPATNAASAKTQPMKASSVAKASSAQATSSVRSSRQSLDKALDAIWSDKAAFLAGKKDVYSDIYNAVVEKNELHVSSKAFLADIAGIAAARPKGFTSNTQDFGGNNDSISGIVDAWAGGKLPAAGPMAASNVERTFFRFERGPKWQPEKISQRVYLNAAADHAPALMKFVVQQIIDNPAKFPGVEMAKLSGPGAVGGRSENIVMYTHGDEASQRVLDAVAAYRAQHPSHFMSGVPAFTEQVAPGVATGDEPAIGGGRMSFGSLRAGVIEGALRTASQQGLDRQGFGRLVDEALQKSQVDPARPHKNLKVARGLS
jgi:hypothetical protein